MHNRRDASTADAELAAAILQDAAERLVDLMPPLEVARAVASFGVLGLMALGGYEEVISTIPVAVAQAVEGQRGEISAHG